MTADQRSPRRAGWRWGAHLLAAIGLGGGVSVSGVATPASAADFSNPTPIVLPLPGVPGGCPPSCPSEPASPFPSTIAVAGLSGTVTDVEVVLRNITYEHNGLPDADVQLVAPGGKAVMLLSDACGDDDNFRPVASPITLTLDDQAAGALPADGACTTGTFRPVDDDDDGEFPFHDPPDAFPGGPAAPAGTRPLSDFNGIDPNGTWSLYVVDDYPNTPDSNGRAGQIGGGWTIDITTTATAPPPTTAAPPGTTPTTSAAAGPAPAPTTPNAAPTTAPRGPAPASTVTTAAGAPTAAGPGPAAENAATKAADQGTATGTATAEPSDATGAGEVATAPLEDVSDLLLPASPASSASGKRVRGAVIGMIVAAALLPALLVVPRWLNDRPRRPRRRRLDAGTQAFAGLRTRRRRRRLRRQLGV